MKKKTALWAGIIAFVLVVGCIIISVISHQDNKKNQNVELFSCLPSDIVRYSVENGENSYVLIKVDGIWQVEGNDVAVLDQDSVQDLVNNASMINAHGILEEKDLESFDTSAVQTVTLTLTDGSEFRICFLGFNGEISAIRVNDGTENYKSHKSTRDILVASLDKLRATLVFDQLKKTDEVLNYYSFTDYDKTKLVVRTKTSSEISKSKSNRYIMESPYKKDVDDEAFEQQIIVRIPLLAVASYVDDAPDDLAQYGLDEKSRAEIRFKWGASDETLYLGLENGGMVYALRKGQEGVFAITTSQLEFLHTEPFYILKTGILSSDIENIRSIKVKTADASYDVISQMRNSSNGQFFVNGADASKLAFNSVLELVSNIEIISEISGDPEDKGEIVITVCYDNGTATQKISLTGQNEKYYVAFINGKAEFDVSRGSVNALLDELNNISKNPMKTDKEG